VKTAGEILPVVNIQKNEGNITHKPQKDIKAAHHLFGDY
jgi:hypothetical protein